MTELREAWAVIVELATGYRPSVEHPLDGLEMARLSALCERIIELDEELSKPSEPVMTNG